MADPDSSASLVFRPYTPADRTVCLQLIDANIPTNFAPNERADYEQFLDGHPATYRVGRQGGDVLAAFGFMVDENRGRIQWIMVAPTVQGAGVGGTMMELALDEARRRDVLIIDIAASQKSAPFFAKYGAKPHKVTPEGWGPGLDRVDMELVLGTPS